MARRYQWSMTALMLLVVWGCATSSSLKDQSQPLAQATPRFTKAGDGVITDSVTGLQWYVNPSPANTWHQAKAWAENLTVAGGGWRLPTMAELKGIYQKGASGTNMDPLFDAQGVWVWSGEVVDPMFARGLAFYNGWEWVHGVNYGYGRLAFAVRSRR
jgi:Protein of unknown function (DUF1566)